MSDRVSGEPASRTMAHMVTRAGKEGPHWSLAVLHIRLGAAVRTPSSRRGSKAGKGLEG